ncbi:hypothetical protein [Sporomusa termitida]|uniref:Uncharacterized protein n=1 Tax=Sporomusa termitida TaxID=2377 RepID=A0A517DPI2_9FIRM|nr:hypothetical protein [Sporomusa termitida]QDR79275.1 hypothetical protein SPTER_05480 [Sporomusa termitida]
MSDENRTRLRPAAGPRRRRPRAGQADRVGLKRLLNQVFDQYIAARVEQILLRAGTQDADYRETGEKVSAALGQLLALSRKLKDRQPEMTGLVMDFETWTTLESGQAAEIAYRQGLRDSSEVCRELMAFLQQR